MGCNVSSNLKSPEEQLGRQIAGGSGCLASGGRAGICGGCTTTGGSGGGLLAQAVKSSAETVSISASLGGFGLGNMGNPLVFGSRGGLFGAVAGLGLLGGAQGDGQGFGMHALALGQVGHGATVAPGVAGPCATDDEQQHGQQEADDVGEQALVWGHG